MLREYVVSEALHHLGIPTTRALAVTATGATVRREVPLPGAVLARVASSHLRVGSFQYARALEEPDHATLRMSFATVDCRRAPQPPVLATSSRSSCWTG